MERLHALDAARNVLNSKIAKALLEDNKLPNRNLKLRVDRINSDERRSQALCENEQRLFKKQGLLYNFEPTMVVERPPSPDVAQSLQEHGNLNKMPHYMTDLDKNRQLPTYIPIPKVDAFKVTRKRKKNVWEEKYSSKDMNEQFRSIISKSPPLSSGEQLDLDKGWTLYRPVSRFEEALRQTLKSKTQNRQRLAKSVKPKPTSSSEVFITQLAVEANIGRGRSSRRQSTKHGSDKAGSNSSASALLQSKLRSTAIMELDQEKMQQFHDMRQRQRRSYHRYLR